jgi:16S rRNA (guanine527-N7)-methyltransferase
LDFGSGGGSPAIPLRILLPEADLTMVESRSRKVAFLRDVVRVVGLHSVDVSWGRVEGLGQTVSAGSIDVVTVRALRMDAGISATVNRVLAPSGRLLMYGPADHGALVQEFRSVAVSDTVGDVTVLERR